MSKVCSCRGEKGGVCSERRSDREEEDVPLLDRGLEDSKVKGQQSKDNRSKDSNQFTPTPSDSKDTKSWYYLHQCPTCREKGQYSFHQKSVIYKLLSLTAGYFFIFYFLFFIIGLSLVPSLYQLLKKNFVNHLICHYILIFLLHITDRLDRVTTTARALVLLCWQ